MARNDPDVGTEVTRMKREAPSEWLAKVRSTRVRRIGPDMDTADSPGLATLADGRAVRAQFVTALTAHIAVSETVEVLWLLESEFLAYYVHKHLYHVDRAQDLWAVSVRNPDILRRGEGTAMRIPAQGPPRTVGSHGRTLSRGVRTETVVETAQHEAEAVQRMNALTASGMVMDTDFIAVGGEAFRTGASVGAGAGNYVSMSFPSVQVGSAVAPPAPRSLIPQGMAVIQDSPAAGPEPQ